MIGVGILLTLTGVVLLLFEAKVGVILIVAGFLVSYWTDGDGPGDGA